MSDFIEVCNQTAATVAERWRQQYAKGQHGADKFAIQAKLDRLEPDASLDAVDQIIGNNSWTHEICTRCRKSKRGVIRVGDEPDYESSTIWLCRECVLEVIDELGRLVR